VPLPTAVFLDTSVFAGQQYDFESTALASFVPVAKKQGLKFLLPDPTRREIVRQIHDRSREALDALAKARRQAPFLKKWKHFPPVTKPSSTLSDLDAVEWEVGRIALAEWRAFLEQLDVAKLAYDGVNLQEIMLWYMSGTAPFGEGSKRKEFPDAFVVAMLDAYARKNECVIAVVSADKDFRLACERYPSFLYFDTLPRLTERLLADPETIERLRLAILEDMSELEASLRARAEKQEFFHLQDDYTVKETAIGNVSVREVRIVAIGANECTATFEAEIELEHLLKWIQWDEEHDTWEQEEWVYEPASISGTVKFALDPESSKVKAITSIETDMTLIEISGYPEPQQWRSGASASC